MTNSANIIGTHPRLMGRLITDTDVPCSRCSAMGHTNYGGHTPMLKRIAEDQRRADEPELPFCNVHGYQSI